MSISFEKVSYEAFRNAWVSLYGDNDINEELIHLIYDGIKLPTRSSDGSAGYDFYVPFGFSLSRYEDIVVPTGIKMHCDKDVFLMILPRSGTGFKYHVTLANTAGIIDSDYDKSDNEGHIMIKLLYEGFSYGRKIVKSDGKNIDPENIVLDTKMNMYEVSPFTLNQNDRFAQGIFVQYKTIDDEDTGNMKTRNGGMGSSGN